jgi:tetratricopeptide (TPR) repeat protein
VGHLSSIITDYPAWAYPYFNRGAAYYFLGRYEESLTDLTRADELAPGNSGTIGNRAVVYGKLHRYEEQLAEYDRALELDPRNTVVLGNLGEISLLLGRTDEALELHERALEIDPLYVWSRMNRAGVLALLDRCPEAVEEMRAAEDLLDRTNRFLITSVHSVFFWKCPADHDPAKALASARESVEAQPEDQQLIVAFAEALYREKRYGEAREAFLRADEMSDPDAHRLFFLAMSSWQLGDKTKARAYFDRGLAWMEDYAPKSPRLVLLREEASRLLGIRS